MATEPQENATRFNLVDLFSGIGGLTVGFRDASTEPGAIFVARLMVDTDREARRVAARNMPDVPFLMADVHGLSGAEVRDRAGLRREDEVHVLVGGPPCQGFSWLGKRALDDERNACILDFLRLTKELRPMVALMENVPLIVTSHGGAIIREINDGLSAMGYATTANVLAASEFGVPQLRKRAFVVAYRSDLATPPQLPARTHERVLRAAELLAAERRLPFEADKLPYVSVEQAIGDLPPLAAGEGEEGMFYASPAADNYQRWARRGSVAIFNHRSRAHSAKFLGKIEVIGEGGRNQELPDDQRFSDNYYSQAYARLHRHGIAQTVTTCFGNPGSGRFTHYRDLRSITVREAARFQSFPDLFVFHGHHSVQMRHVGNAVPPLLGRALRDQIVRDLLAAGVSSATPRKLRPVAEAAEQPSRTMRAVKGQSTSVELALREALCDAGLRGYRLHYKNVPGSPDVAFTSKRVAVFVDGCFWHGCPRCYRAPKSNIDYWKMKIERNRSRDAKIDAACRANGWRVVRVWEHDVLARPAHVVSAVRKAVRQRAPTSRPPSKSSTSRTRATSSC